jgi:hypothetical protein
MIIQLCLGVAGILYGLYTAYLRVTAPHKLDKLDAMKQQWGDQTGTVVHVLFYTAVPIAVGAVFVIQALMRAS